MTFARSVPRTMSPSKKIKYDKAVVDSAKYHQLLELGWEIYGYSEFNSLGQPRYAEFRKELTQ